MKMKPKAEPAARRLKTRQVLEPTPERLPYDEVLTLIEEVRPELLKLAELHQGKVTAFTLGREVMDILPELKARYAPKEKDWRRAGVILSIHEPRDYLAGAVAFFPNHRAEIQNWHTDAIKLIGREASSGGAYGFLNAQALSWIQPSSGSRWKELMDKHWSAAFEEIKQEPNHPAEVNELARLLLSKPNLRTEVQAVVTPLMPAIRQFLRTQLDSGSQHTLPDILWALKIIFSTSVEVDEFGRLTFEAGERAGLGQRKELPPRLAV